MRQKSAAGSAFPEYALSGSQFRLALKHKDNLTMKHTLLFSLDSINAGDIPPGPRLHGRGDIPPGPR